MRVLIACDSFKDGLDARGVCNAIARGLQESRADFQIFQCPLADGGEGTAEILTLADEGKMVEVMVRDPLGRSIKAQYGISKDRNLAFIDLASASGLERLKPEERNPLLTSTFGTGQLISHAKEQGVERVYLGVGGSATNDGGMGMAVALGAEIIDRAGNLLEGRGKDLDRVDRIVRLPEELPEIVVLCDVTNPLTGPVGAAHTYAAQKGASPEIIEYLDAGLKHLAATFQESREIDIASFPGSGAAGGAAFGARAFLNGKIESGVEFVLEFTGFDVLLENADIVITGEGRIDAQSSQGKLVSGVTRKANSAGVPVIGLCGKLDLSPVEVSSLGLKAAFSIVDRPMLLEEALSRTGELLERTSFNLGSLLSI